MKIRSLLILAGIAGAFVLGAGKVSTQQPGQGSFNFDPAQIQRMMLDGYREQLEISDDAEWKIVEQRVQKILDARREAGFGGAMGGMARMFGRGRQQGGGQRAGGFFPKPGPEEEALQKALDGKASSADLKAALARFIEARKQKQASLEKAQAELREVLSLRQEVSATLSGLL